MSMEYQLAIYIQKTTDPQNENKLTTHSRPFITGYSINSVKAMIAQWSKQLSKRRRQQAKQGRSEAQQEFVRRRAETCNNKLYNNLLYMSRVSSTGNDQQQ